MARSLDRCGRRSTVVPRSLTPPCSPPCPSMRRPLTPDHVPWNEHYPAYLGPSNVPLALAGGSSSSSSSSGGRGPLGEVRVADVGCGFGGMTVALGEIFPDKLVLGLEIRDKVVDIVKDRVTKLRKAAASAASKASATATTDQAVVSEFHTTNSASPSPAPWTPHAPSYASSAASFTYENISCVKVNFMKYAPNYFRKGQLEKIFFLFADPHFKKVRPWTAPPPCFCGCHSLLPLFLLFLSRSRIFVVA
jgi:tRNA (guanine-N7-)-methyltransferase